MDVLINLLLWVHLLAIVAGGSNSVAMPLLGSRLASAGPETREAIFWTAGRLSRVGRGAMGILLITGPLLVWLKYGGFGGMNVWFWIKMALVLVVLLGMIYNGTNFKKAQQGDRTAGSRAEMGGKITGIAFLGVILAAVFAFN